MVEEGVTKCGGLEFTGQSGRWAGTYDVDLHVLEDSLWTVVRKLWRTTSSTSFTDSIVQNEQVEGDTIDVPFALDQNLDLVGLELHFSATGEPPGIGEGVEAWAQIWRKIDEPSTTSITVSKDSVFIDFENNSNARAIDSTWVQHQACDTCQWVHRGAVGGNAELFIDTLVSPGTYVYRLKHVTLALPASGLQAPPRPNSGWDISGEVTVVGPPADLGCGPPPKFQNQVQCDWTNADPDWSTQVFRNDSLKATLDPGVSSYTDAGLGATSGSVYAVRHESGGDVTGFSNPDTVWGTLTASPSNLSCGACVTCQWQNGNEDYPTEIWRSETSASEGYAIRDTAGPGATTYNDAAVDSLETYWYRVRHIGFYAFGADSDPDSVVACTLEPMGFTP